jgi:hypothetical protein
MAQAFQTVLSRGGIKGMYQGLIPWAWIEASTKGGVLLFASGEVETIARERFALGTAASGLVGGMAGGIAQAYATMGEHLNAEHSPVPISDASLHDLPLSIRFLHMHEDGRDHSTQASRFGCQASWNVRSVYGNLPTRRNQGNQ